MSMNLLDRAHRLVYRHGFRAARFVWRFTTPRHSGALAMIWRGERVLMIRTSYQDGWMAPGGGIKRGETPAEAVLRELSEELGLRLTSEQLHPAPIVEHFWNNRHDKVHFFEVQLAAEPELEVDNREVTEAKFVTLHEAKSLSTSPHLADYFRWKGGGPAA
jgi:8-oxo-dGTP diphosphatase